jgi:hypothetical protein
MKETTGAQGKNNEPQEDEKQLNTLSQAIISIKININQFE